MQSQNNLWNAQLALLNMFISSFARGGFKSNKKTNYSLFNRKIK